MNSTSFSDFSVHGVTGSEGKDTDMFYAMYLDGPQGAKFELLIEHNHTPEDIKNAKQWLKANQDVVSITTIKLKY